MNTPPPSWPKRALVLAGTVMAVPALGAVLAGTWAAVTARDAVKAALGIPLGHRSRCQCGRCRRKRSATPDRKDHP